MQHDMITVFNQLTSSKLADCDLFKNLLDEHFLKFRYFYSLINGIDLKKIEKIDCETKAKHISICITPHDNNYINSIITTINKKKKKSNMTKYFKLNLVECGSNIYIDIYLYNLAKEGDLYYDDRFI